MLCRLNIYLSFFYSSLIVDTVIGYRKLMVPGKAIWIPLGDQVMEVRGLSLCIH